MKSMKGFWLLMALLAVPVHAGQGTIEETETAIIVEYTGDASDRSAEKVKSEATVVAPKAQVVELQQATAEADVPVIAKQGTSVRDAKANKSDAQRQKQAARAASRAIYQATRQNRTEPE